VAGTLIGALATASSRTSGNAISRQVALRLVRGRLMQEIVLLLQQPVPPARFPQLSGIIPSHARPCAGVDVRGTHPVRLTRLGDPEVLGDLLQRDLALSGDRDGIVTKPAGSVNG
jgi:hypothetical protein